MNPATHVADFLRLTKSTVGLLFMVVPVGTGERMAGSFDWCNIFSGLVGNLLAGHHGLDCQGAADKHAHHGRDHAFPGAQVSNGAGTYFGGLCIGAWGIKRIW